LAASENRVLTGIDERGAKQATQVHQCERTPPALVLAIRVRTGRFHCYYQGVSHAEWPKDEHA